MATWLDQQIDDLEHIVGKRLDYGQATCSLSCCVLPSGHEDTEPHISLAAFLEMQVRYGARIFAGRACGTPDPVHTNNS